MRVRPTIGVCRSFTCPSIIKIIQAQVEFYRQEVTYSRIIDKHQNMHFFTFKTVFV